ncbi:hypothetical protein VM1G_09708 [Cytospora mali]|uniref:Uncharacterized protein n=1 Tax=Cytospora mali TaxID=578113 RepID=A0A0M4ATG6_CYTMA|nr:hypothetical protein [Valsa mali]KUI74064.1 hypothetical protein VM1G_09708 [Valsa mali]
MLGKTLTTLISLLATSKAVSIARHPLGIDLKPQARNESAPDIEAIISIPAATFKSYSKGGLVRDGTIIAEGEVHPKTAMNERWTCSTSPSFTWGDKDDGGLGMTITNADAAWRAFYIYYNTCDYVPYKYVWISPGGTVFVSLPAMFQGRITRGTDEWNLGGVPRPLGTWLEFALDNNSWIWGDVSLIRGCDGGVLVWSLDDSGSWKGFTQDILEDAPSSVYDVKPSGELVIAATENWDGTTNWPPMMWDFEQVGPELVYVDDAHGNPVIVSKDGRFGTYWPAGRL